MATPSRGCSRPSQPSQAHRVHLLELAEKDRPRAFNPIELDGADPELVAAQFVDTMRDLYFATLGSAHRQIQYLRNALMTLLTMPPGADGPWTLDSLYSLFVDARFRENFTRGLKDPVLAAFWKHQWQADSRRGSDPSADAILSKLGAFLSYPSIRAIVSAPVSTIRPRRIMDAGDVLLVDLSGVGRDHMRLFGSLLIARYGVAALGRQRVPPADRTPHTLYVDEVQNFDTSSLRGMPAEGRKFGLLDRHGDAVPQRARHRAAERHPGERRDDAAAPAVGGGCWTPSPTSSRR